jgi:hypothetical protein
MSLINEQLKKIDHMGSAEIVFANHASAAFNLRLYTTLKRITADVHQALGENLVALILGGGYGRGEGGVVRRHGKECPYNDLDFTLIVERKGAVNFEALDQISQKYGVELNIHVDFSRPLNLTDIQNFPHWLMWQDLLKGHVVTFGAREILNDHAPASLGNQLPTIEATRLLINRGAGLLWAMRVAQGIEEAPDFDFVRRNYYKCALALGDAMLITHHRYKTHYTGRQEILNQIIAEQPAVKAMELNEIYVEAHHFKFTPDEISIIPKTANEMQELAIKWITVFLYVESQRTGQIFQTIDQYLDWNGLREIEQHRLRKLPRNLIRNLQAKKFSTRYPREELFRTLPKLFTGPDRHRKNWVEDGEKFLQLWRQFN